MEPETYQRLQAIVRQAVELPPEQRLGFLAQVCGDAEELLAEAQRLLPLMADDAGAYSEWAVEARRSDLDVIFESARRTQQSDGWIPERIGDYLIRGVLGRGGSGVVFEAEQPSPLRSVALKLLHPSLATEEASARIRKEAEALARLQHPGIAQIFEAGTFNLGGGEQPFLVMELVDGYDLARHVHHSGLDIRARVELLARVCDAVQHAHERGIVHRDLKPDNVLVDSAGQPKLLDFGIARIAREHSLSVEALTAEGQLLGTAAYMAPEQAQAHDSKGGSLVIGPATDVFALGAIGFELSVGRRPRQLDGLTLTQMMYEVAAMEIVSLRSVDPTVDVDLETIVGKACETEPARRYESAAALGADLRRWLDNRPIAARPPTAAYRAKKFISRHRILALGVLATVTSLTLGLALSLYLAAVARSAAAETQRKLYAAEMLVATGSSMEPSTRIRSARLTEHWLDEPELLGWEWYLMDAVRRRNVVALDLPDFPLGLDWHPDGEQVAVVMETTVGVFDSRSGTPIAIRSFEDQLPECLLSGVRWNAEGTRLAISGEFRVFLWEPEPGKNRGTVHWEHEAEFAPDLCWHPDGKSIYYVGHSIVGLSAATGAVIYRGDARPWGISGNVFDSDGDRIAFARYSDAALTFHFPSLAPDIILEDVRISVLSRVDWSSDDRLVAATGTDHSVRVVDAASGELRFTNRDHTEAMFGVDWHPNGRELAVSAADGTVRVLDGRTGECLETYLRHETKAYDVRWSPDGRRLGSVAINGEALVWDKAEPSAFSSILEPRLGHEAFDQRLQWEPISGRLLATKSSAGTSLLPGKEWAPEAVDFRGRVSLSVDRDWRATSQGAPALRIERRSDGAVVHQESLGNDAFLMHDWVPGQDVLLAGSRHGLWRFDVSKDGEVRSTRLADIEGQVGHLRCAPNGRRCAFTHANLCVTIADIQTGKRLTEIEPVGRVAFRSLCWSPDGERIALASSDGALRIANASTGVIESTLLGHTNQVEGVHWHPTEPRIATCSRDGTVKLWDSRTGDLTAQFLCEAPVGDVHWIRGGMALVALDAKGRIYSWDASRALEAE